MKNIAFISLLAAAAYAGQAIPAHSGLEIYKSERSVQADTATQNFVAEAARAGMKEVQMGKVGQQKASNPRVKAFAAMMVADHSKANAELKQIAAANHVSIPMSKVDTVMHNHLQSKAGRGFDYNYMNMMIKDHQKAINLFTRAKSNVKDEPIRAFAEKTLPTLRMHLDSARAIYKALMPSTR